MVVFLFKYRHRPGRKAEYIEGNSKLEITWTSVTAVILIVARVAEPLDLGRYQGERARAASSSTK